MTIKQRFVLFLVAAAGIGTQIGLAMVAGDTLRALLWYALFGCLLAARGLTYLMCEKRR